MDHSSHINNLPQIKDITQKDQNQITTTDEGYYMDGSKQDYEITTDTSSVHRWTIVELLNYRIFKECTQVDHSRTTKLPQIQGVYIGGPQPDY